MANENTTLIDENAVGVEVSWSFGGGDADAVQLQRSQVNQILASYGFAELEAKSDTDALKHAARISRPGKTHIVRELARPKKDTPIAFGVYKVDAVDGEKGDDVGCGARVRFEAARAVCLPPEGALGDPECMVIGARIAKTANELFTIAYNKDLSDHLLAIGNALNWVTRRRNKGGVYFILARRGTGEAARAERFVGLLQALQQLSKQTDGSEMLSAEIVEVYPRPLANETISGAAKAAFHAEVERLARELDRMMTAGNMRESTVEKRADECDEILRRAEQYREWLQESTDALATRLTSIRDRFRSSISAAAEAAQSDLAAIEEIETVVPETAPLPEKKGRRPVESGWEKKDFDLSFFDLEA